MQIRRSRHSGEPTTPFSFIAHAIVVLAAALQQLRHLPRLPLVRDAKHALVGVCGVWGRKLREPVVKYPIW